MENTKLSGRDRKFVVMNESKARIDGAWVLHRVEERKAERLVRSFTVRITQTQAARPTAKHEVVRWCELFGDKVPTDGGTVDIDLNYVQKL
jgi:hypothetical protein